MFSDQAFLGLRGFLRMMLVVIRPATNPIRKVNIKSSALGIVTDANNSFVWTASVFCKNTINANTEIIIIRIILTFFMPDLIFTD
jgi:hypothetical protein